MIMLSHCGGRRSREKWRDFECISVLVPMDQTQCPVRSSFCSPRPQLVSGHLFFHTPPPCAAWAAAPPDLVCLLSDSELPLVCCVAHSSACCMGGLVAVLKTCWFGHLLCAGYWYKFYVLPYVLYTMLSNVVWGDYCFIPILQMRKQKPKGPVALITLMGLYSARAGAQIKVCWWQRPSVNVQLPSCLHLPPELWIRGSRVPVWNTPELEIPGQFSSSSM